MGTYRERLLVPVSYWLLAVPVVILLGSEAYFFVDGWIPLVVIGALAVIVAAFLIRWSTGTIEVAGGELRADGDALPLTSAAEVISLDEEQSRLLRGPKADPSAHIMLRPYLKRAVCIRLAQDAPGTEPYWLVATRHPDELAAAVERAMRAGDTQAVG